MVTYKGPEKMRNAILSKCKDLFLLNEINVMVFQDYCEKRINTIGSGVVIESGENLYPCAIPDIGCGFHLCRVVGIEGGDILNSKLLYKKIIGLFQGENKIFTRGKYSINEMCRSGHAYTKALFYDNRENKYEDVKAILRNPISNLFRELETCKDLNCYQGHFFEFLEDEIGNVFLLIHSGSWVLADQIIKKYWMAMARESYKRKWSGKEEILKGFFKIPIEKMEELFPEYYNDVLSLYNFTIAYRDIIEHELTEAFNDVFKGNVSFQLESDYSHTRLRITDNEKVIHQRGVQYLKGDGVTRYIMCGTQTKPSLMFVINHDDYFSHGVPEEPESHQECLEYTMQKAIKGELLCPIMTIK